MVGLQTHCRPMLIVVLCSLSSYAHCRPMLIVVLCIHVHHPTPSPPLASTLSCSLRIRVHNLTPSRPLSTSSWYVVLLSSHPGSQSDTITLPLHLQPVRCPALFASGSSIRYHHAPSPPPVGTLSCSLRIRVLNLTPSRSLSTSSQYVILLSSHPGPQSEIITLPLHLQTVRCPALFASGFSI